MAAAATLAPAARPSMLTLYRDDGVLARAVAGGLGRVVPVPGVVLVLAGTFPVLAAVVIGGAGVSRALAGAVLAWFGLTAALSGGRPQTGRLAWGTPPLIRATEYVSILWLGAIAGGSSPAAAFALLCALAFRHYDLVYRMRHRGVTPPPWVNALALGWDGRLLLAWLLLIAGLLPAGFFVAAAILGMATAGDSVVGWLRFVDQQRAGAAGSYEDEEDEGQ